MPTITKPIILDETAQQILRVLKEKNTKVYGVTDINSGTTLTRTDDAVGMNVTLGTSEITSDFDKVFPYSAMHEVKDSLGNVFIFIPKFYSLKTFNTWKISAEKLDGFDTLFKDANGNEIPYVLVGKYKASIADGKLKSVSGVSPAVNTTMDTFRTDAQANGSGYQITDKTIRSIIEMLFVIEFATTDSQSIMQGLCGVSASHVTGGTDSVVTPTGQPVDRTSQGYQCKYRGMEDLWGNVWEFCDGISFSDADVYMSNDPSDYTAGKITDSYHKVGVRPKESGNPQVIEPMMSNLEGYITKVGTSNFGDYSWYAQGGQILLVGGRWDNGSNDGLFCLAGAYGASDASANVGSRLCYKPL